MVLITILHAAIAFGDLSNSHWLLLRPSENPRAEQHFRLRELLRHNLKTILGLKLARLGGHPCTCIGVRYADRA